MRQIILASQSKHRKLLMQNAGIQFETEPSNIDERLIEDTVKGAGLTPRDISQLLADAKALNVSEKLLETYVIGSDQVLALDDELIHKSEDMEAARRKLLYLSGKTHQLHSAISIAHKGEIIWRHISSAELTMRKLSPEFIGHYLAGAGEDVLSCVGAYHFEKTGIQLFEKIEGDLFTIIGLPMLPLLAQLRQLGLIDE